MILGSTTRAFSTPSPFARCVLSEGTIFTKAVSNYLTHSALRLAGPPPRAPSACASRQRTTSTVRTGNGRLATVTVATLRARELDESRSAAGAGLAIAEAETQVSRPAIAGEERDLRQLGKRHELGPKDRAHDAAAALGAKWLKLSEELEASPLAESRVRAARVLNCIRSGMFRSLGSRTSRASRCSSRCRPGLAVTRSTSDPSNDSAAPKPTELPAWQVKADTPIALTWIAQGHFPW